MDVRVLKMFSGELVVGELATEVDEDPADSVKNCDSFTLLNPCIIAYGPQGSGLVPMLPWVDPKGDSVSMSFSGSSVMGELLNVDALPHRHLIENYRSMFSRIVTSSFESSGARVVQGSFGV